MCRIELNPRGGLANRMRTMVAAYYLAKEVGSDLFVYWIKDNGLNAKFGDIFEYPNTERLFVKDVSRLNSFFFDEPSKHNLYLSAIFHRIKNDRIIYNRSVKSLKSSGFDFENWAKGNNCYLGSCEEVVCLGATNYGDILKDLFRPVKDIRDKIDARLSFFKNKNVIGIHIRRTDNIDSIKHSPTSLFLDIAKKHIQADDDNILFLASDSIEVKKEFLNSLPNDRVITDMHETTRSTVEGIVEAIVDMWTLANTNRIYGSFYSSFSEMASKIGGAPLNIVQCNE